MNDINHERGILRHQIKDDVINYLRSHCCDGQLTIDQVFITGLGCRVKASHPTDRSDKLREGASPN